MSNTIQILHSADWHTQNRDNNLYHQYKQILKNKKNVLDETKAEIYLVSGDLFHFTEQTDSEQELIFTHIAEVLRIESVKEVVIMSGNHDIETNYKEFNSEKLFNSLDTLNKFVHTLAPELANKLTYLKKQQQYISKADPRLGWISYSLEDGMSNGNNIDFEKVDNTKFNISVFHDIVRNYVEDSGLPVSNDKLKNLPYVKDFKTHNILAGDIHENYTTSSSFLQLQENGNFKQKFVYSGSSNQTNHKEGAYIILRKTKTKKIVGEKKVLKLHTANLNDNESILETKDIIIPDVVTYITIDLNTRYSLPNHMEEILKNLNDSTLFGTDRTFIKLKISSEYLKFEAKIYNTLRDFCLQFKNVEITIVHDQLVLEVDEKIAENNEEIEINNNSVLEKLDNEKLHEMFSSVIETVLGEEVYGVDNSSVIESVRTLFLEQLSLSNLFDTKTYYSVLKDVSFNGFMRLGANKIDLSIEGLIRIDGTNGVGKTTLFNILRYAIKGIVYEGLNPKATKNKALIFNTNYQSPADDEIELVLNALVNNTPIRITRKSSRKWKTNTTEDQKKSKASKNYINTITTSVQLVVMKDGEQPKIFEGDEAEKYLEIFFADVVDNLMILNQTKLINTINMTNSDLRSMILNYIGVNFLKILDDNLESLKLNYNLQRPKNKIEDIRLALDENKKIVGDSVIKTKKFNDDLIVISEDISLLKNNEITQTNKLIEFGDVDKNILNSNTKISEFEQLIADFKPKNAPEPLSINKPILNTEQINIFEIENVKLNNAITTLNTNTENFRNDINVLLKSNEKTESDNQKLREELKILNDENEAKINHNYAVIISNSDNILSKLKENRTNCLGNVGGFDAKIINLKNANITLQNDINSGVCGECSRAFDEESHKIHTEKNTKLIEENLVEIQTNEENKTKTNTLISQLDTFIKRYESISSLSHAKNLAELQKIQYSESENVIYKSVVLIGELIETNTQNDLECEQKIVPLINALTDTKILIINEKISENNSNVLILNNKLNSNNTEIKAINDNHILDMTSYNNSVTTYNNLVTEVNEHNVKISSYQTNLITEKNNLTILENKKPDYDLCVKNKKETLDLIAEKELEKEKVVAEKHEFELKLKDVESKITALNLEHDNYIKYIYDTKVFGTYQKIIQNNLPELVFNYYRSFINGKLNILLEDMSIKLYLDETCNLFMIDMSQGEIVYVPVQTISGMQVVMLGLSLMYTISLLNNTNKISHIFIDELSGALNKGKNNLGEANINYQEQFVKLLSKFTEKNIYIVDHAIDNLFNNYTYTVIFNKEDKKSYYIGKI